MKITRNSRSLETMELKVVMKEVTPTREQNFQQFISYETSVDQKKVSCRFKRSVDTKPFEELYKEGIRRFTMICKSEGISSMYTYPRIYIDSVEEVIIEE